MGADRFGQLLRGVGMDGDNADTEPDNVAHRLDLLRGAMTAGVEDSPALAFQKFLQVGIAFQMARPYGVGIFERTVW